jgi:hypothetical protein
MKVVEKSPPTRANLYARLATPASDVAGPTTTLTKAIETTDEDAMSMLLVAVS